MDAEVAVEQDAGEAIERTGSKIANRAQLPCVCGSDDAAGFDLVAGAGCVLRVVARRRVGLSSPAEGATEQNLGKVADRVVRAADDVATAQLVNDRAVGAQESIVGSAVVFIACMLWAIRRVQSRAAFSDQQLDLPSPDPTTVSSHAVH